MSETTVLARKWRPKNFAQLAGQQHVVQALGNALSQNRLHHAYLFTGTRGVGKTTIARIFAKSLNCETGITATPCGVCNACTEIDSGRFIDLIELDAASNTQVDNMRELLDGAMYAPSNGRFKVYIIDEVHMLTKNAFNAMLKTLEEPPLYVKFILATTDPQKIPVTVLSRCLQFNLKQLPPVLITEHLQFVLGQEHIPFENAALNLIARAAQGSMRDALSLLDQAIAYSSGRVDEALVRTMLGAIDQGYLYDLIDKIADGAGEQLIAIADDMLMRSIAFDAALQDLASLLHRLALAQTIPEAIADDEPERARILSLAQRFSPEELQLHYQIAIHGRNEINLAPDEYAGFTMTLLRMLAFAPQLTGVAKTASAAPIKVLPTRSDTPPSARSEIPKVAEKIPAALVSPTVKFDENNLDWHALLGQLNLSAMAQQLARHSVLQSFAKEQLVLNLAAQNKATNTKNAFDTLQAALSYYFQRPIKLRVEVSELGAVATPAAVEKQQQQTRQQHAEMSIKQDPFVQDAQRLLGATILENSIKSIS